MNTVSLIGRLTADPESRVGEKAEAASFRLAVPRRASDTADFVDVVSFDALARTVADHLTKGRQVAVTGRLRLNEWTTSEGERRSKLQVVADDVTFLDRPKANANGSDEAEAADRPASGRDRNKVGAR